MISFSKSTTFPAQVFWLMCLISPLYVLLDFILGPGCEGDYGNRTLCIVPILIPLSYVRRIIGQRRALAPVEKAVQEMPASDRSAGTSGDGGTSIGSDTLRFRDPLVLDQHPPADHGREADRRASGELRADASFHQKWDPLGKPTRSVFRPAGPEAPSRA